MSKAGHSKKNVNNTRKSQSHTPTRVTHFCLSRALIFITRRVGQAASPHLSVASSRAFSVLCTHGRVIPEKWD